MYNNISDELSICLVEQRPEVTERGWVATDIVAEIDFMLHIMNIQWRLYIASVAVQSANKRCIQENWSDDG